jgi:hypothetical protein
MELTTLGDQTLRSYLFVSPNTTLHLLTARPLSIYDAEMLHQTEPAFPLFLKEQILQPADWSKRQEKKEPITLLMLQVFSRVGLSTTEDGVGVKDNKGTWLLCASNKSSPFWISSIDEEVWLN